MIMDLAEICNQFFKDDKPENATTKICTLSGPSVLKREIKHAINLMKNNKVPGPDVCL